MKQISSLLLLIIFFTALNTQAVTLKQLTAKNELQQGFVGQIFDEKNGKLYLKVDNLDSEFIYQTSLPQGLGSNDIGLDRGQLSDVRLVEFNRVGNKLLLIQKNTQYRAISENKNESESVEDAFASAVLWSFPIVEVNKQWLLVDASDFILQDSHGVVRKLKQRKQGNFKLDQSRSAIYLPRTKSFPDNTELEARITFTSDKPGNFIKQAAIDANVISLRTHHSFVRLPKAGYKPRIFHPQSGYWLFAYQDYAQPINQPITQRFIGRHRLQKKNPNAALSEAVKPIIYYLDPGAPEPVKTALITGASWWNQAFESIGYKNAFQVKVLPDNADPMDIRYNVIQWVHRATRGWSYGYGVTDPRNGEIIKGHVTLGSLRVRQDYLIAQGMLSLFDENNTENDQALMDLALARIRQLSAHEVGHTLGLAHNFAASAFGRASVMDYPHPLFEINNEKITADNAYAENIGVWDKATIAYGYQHFSPENEASSLAKILDNNQESSYLFISDPDSRQKSNAHPKSSLWDNGENTIDELERVLKLRQLALSQFGVASLQSGRPFSDLQEILIPVYYFHRYQATAAAKWIGGVNYSYSIKNSSNSRNSVTASDAKEQKRALEILIKTLSPEFLEIDNTLESILLPKAMGYQASRESAVGKNGVIFDPISLAAASIQHTLSLILEPTRLSRLQQQNNRNNKQMSITELTDILNKNTIEKVVTTNALLIHQTTIDLIISNYANLIQNEKVATQVKTELYGVILKQINQLEKKLKPLKSSSNYFAFYHYQLQRLKLIKPKNLKNIDLIQLPKMPPGSPI
jgi:hypothetical protein